ncbi:unnamed protein product [Kluyveromyces dobzhanskii CBS 2104]|uniref:WGS project CCBQ000000000 data, contig 00015 n=1 Tax=Kluyveromyces dobzhanskii CBS 2104 TaxID=1427455 RepID=A0A0A8LCM9_9SACH|nr:unnamed protein product [Kluyveromyces dobzhanskii CBS 2104]
MPLKLNEKNGVGFNHLDSVDVRRSSHYGDMLPAANHESFEQEEVGGNIDWQELAANEQFRRRLKNDEHVKVYRKKKGFKQFRRLVLAQELNPYADGLQNSSSSNDKGSSLGPGGNNDAVWCVRFSHDGKFMATAGKDETLRIWKVISSPAERLELNQHSISFLKSTTNAISQLNGQLAQCGYDADSASLNSGSSNTQVDSLTSFSLNNKNGNPTKSSSQNQRQRAYGVDDRFSRVFHPDPCATLHEHTDDILDIDWSKNSFILTGSMDKTCKLWHCERSTSLKTFVHPDFVTGVRFHPDDDRFFLSACLDQKCRLWSILDKEVIFEYDSGDLITALDISYDGKYTILGTFNGNIHVLVTKSLELLFSFNVLDKNSELKNCHKTSRLLKKHSHKKTKHGPKITGIEFLRKEGRTHKISSKDISDWFLVSSNDSRIRIYTLKQELVSMMRGHSNEHSQITAHSIVTRSGKAYIVSGSEDHWIYCWKISDDIVKSEEALTKGKKSRRSRSGSLRNSFCKKHNDDDPFGSDALDSVVGDGSIKNTAAISNSNYIGFHAHHHPITCATAVPPQTSNVLSLSNDLICELTMQFWETSDDVTVERAKKQPTLKRNGTCISQNGGQKTDKTEKKANGKGFNSGLQQNQSSNLLAQNGSNYSIDSTTNTAGNQPSLAEFIGGIVVSADTTGVIRVFRSDLSANVRKKVMKKLDLVEKQLKENNDYPVKTTGSVASSNAANTYSGMSTGTTFVGNGNSNVNSVNLTIDRPTLFTVQDTLVPLEESSSSVTTLNQQQPQSHSKSRVCNVCGGLRFGTDQQSSLNPFAQNVKCYCLDCGALYTTLR